MISSSPFEKDGYIVIQTAREFELPKPNKLPQLNLSPDRINSIWGSFRGFRHLLNENTTLLDHDQAQEAINLITIAIQPLLGHDLRYLDAGSFDNVVYDKFCLIKLIADIMYFEKNNKITKVNDQMKEAHMSLLLGTKMSDGPVVDRSRELEMTHDAIMLGFAIGDIIENDFSDTALYEKEFDYSRFFDVTLPGPPPHIIGREFAELGLDANYSFRPYKAKYLLGLEEFAIKEGPNAKADSCLKVLGELATNLKQRYDETIKPLTKRSLPLLYSINNGNDIEEDLKKSIW